MDLFKNTKLTGETKWNASNCIAHSKCLPWKNFFPENIIRKLFSITTQPRKTTWNGHQHVMLMPFTPKKHFFQDDTGDLRKSFLSIADLLGQLRWLSPELNSTTAKGSDAEAVVTINSNTDHDTAPEPRRSSTTHDPMFPDNCVMSFVHLIPTSIPSNKEQLEDARPHQSRSSLHLSMLFEPLPAASLSNSPEHLEDVRPHHSTSSLHLSTLFEQLPAASLLNSHELEDTWSHTSTNLHLSMMFEQLPTTFLLNRQAQVKDPNPNSTSHLLPASILSSLQHLETFSGRISSVSQPPLHQSVELNINLQVLTPHKLAFKRTLSGEFLVLGSGVFGVVYLATCLDDGRLVAVKLFYHAIEYYAAILQEARILKLLEPTGFVPRLYGLCPEAWDSRKATIVQEFYGNGVTLRSLISDSLNWQGLTMLVKLNIVYQLVYGLKAIHEQGVLINDIKDDNILVNTDDHRIRYIDFGHATYMCVKVFPGTAETNARYLHLAPEARAGMQTTTASDVYSLGYMIQRFQVGCLQELVRHCLQNEACYRRDLGYIVYVLEEML